MPDEQTPGTADAILPVAGPLGQRGYEEVEIRGNREDNQTEALRQHRQILAYRARFSDTLSDAVLWVAVVAAVLRGVVVVIRSGVIAPIYPIGLLLLLTVPTLLIAWDTIQRYPTLRTACCLRVGYVLGGVAIALL